MPRNADLKAVARQWETLRLLPTRSAWPDHSKYSNQA